jgi:hypothetical protein
VEEAVEEAVEEVVEEVVVEEYPHQDHPKQLDRMYPRQEEKLKPWDNSHESSLEIEAKPTTSSTNSADICD